MKLSQFKYDLPLNLIAQHPAKSREESRLMVVHRNTGKIEHKVFKDIIDYYDDRDVMIVNNTKVFPARLYGKKEKTGAQIEVFLLRELNKPNRLWDVIVDLRPDSPTFLQWFGETLSAENRRMMFVPKGFGHGFITLEPDTEAIYFVTEFYSPEHERGLRWDDPKIGIEWPIEPVIISEKDRQHKDFDINYNV